MANIIEMLYPYLEDVMGIKLYTIIVTMRVYIRHIVFILEGYLCGDMSEEPHLKFSGKLHLQIQA